MSRLNAPAYGPLFSLRHLNLSNLYKWNTRKHPSWEHRSQSQGGERLREESLPEQKGWTKQDTLRELCVTCCRNSRSLKSTEGTVSEGMTGKYDVSMIEEMVAASGECCIATFIASDCNDQRSSIGSSTIGRDRPFIFVGTMRRRRECGGYRCQAFRGNTANGTNLRGDTKHDDRRRCSQQRSTCLSEGCGHGTTTDIAFVRCHR